MAKILISGQWLWKQYQEACANALERLGHDVVRFGWYRHFYTKNPDGSSAYKSRFAKIQNRFIFGPLISRINDDLFKTAAETRPDIVWLYNDTHILPGTISRLKNLLPQSCFVQYTNDNPWGKSQEYFQWRYFRKSIPLFDLNLCYRKSNVEDFRSGGAREVKLLRSYFIEEEAFPIERRKVEDRFRSDVVFTGHFEDDGRIEKLSDIMKAGWDLKLFGTGWDNAIARLPKDDPLNALVPVKAARGDDYRHSICGAKIAIAFLSKINEDTYTRRNFEIPAMGTFMLSEYTEDLSTLFVEGKEAEFFRDKDELARKLKYYLTNDAEREKVAAAGRDRVNRDGHEVKARMKQFMSDVASVGAGRCAG